jgi:anti-sigma-K factor RskA
VVRVALNADAAPDTFREVWLITADASALVSLGVLEGSEQTFPVPADVDLKDYVLVDVSQEPDDGDANHSGDSIVRGELTFL